MNGPFREAGSGEPSRRPGAAVGPDRSGLGCQRALFSIPRDIHYFNCAYLAPLPKEAEAAGIEAIRQRRAPTGFPAERFFEESDRLKELFGRLIGGAGPGRVAIQPSVSYGIAAAAANVQAEPGQNLLLLEEQFPSNVYAWRRLAGERGLEVRVVARPRSQGARSVGVRWTERVLETIDARTAVVALPQVHWTDGMALDLEPIGLRAREVGAAFVVDASQSVGAHPFDLGRIRPNAVVCAGYKWLMGPYSLCLAWYGPRFDDGVPLEETWIAREGSEDFAGLVRYRDGYREGAARYDVGERSSFIHVPMLTASLRLILGWGPERIQAYCRELLAETLTAAAERGARLSTLDGGAAHIVGVRIPEGTDAGRLQRALEERNVHASLRGDALRLSPNVYDDPVDAEAMREALLAAL